MSLKIALLALFLASLTTGLPIHKGSNNTATEPFDPLVTNTSTHALAKRTTANPPFDPYEFVNNRTDGDSEGDVFRITKCYCVDTPSRDLPPVYGQYYGSYYGFDYYNYHTNRSWALNWTCASGELTPLYTAYAAAESYYLAPKCLGWMKENIKHCIHTDDGNTFCVAVKAGKDFYYWNKQWRQIHNHPAKAGTTKMPAPQMNEECQRMCQTIPANTPGWMQDVIQSDHENKILLAEETVCTPKGSDGPPMDDLCDWPGEEPRKHMIPKKWETWNYIETYTEEADMCKGCA